MKTLAILFILNLIACSTQRPGDMTDATAAGCLDNGECPEGQACFEGTCTPVSCLNDDQCDLATVCDPEVWSCMPGCRSDRDCSAHQTCANGTCADRSCEASSIDCSVGQVCDEATQTCRAVPGVCDDCGACGSSARCASFRDNLTTDTHCYAYCSADADCPAGFTCETFTFPGPFGLGTVDESLCYADCPWLRAEGWL